MIVKIIGKTEPTFTELGDLSLNLPGKARGSAFENRMDQEWPDATHVIEFAGRLCYESWDMPNPNTATNDGYVANLINQGHESVLEHASVTFYVEGVSRNLSHELIRHRHLSFSELSQRFVNMEEANAIIPPGARDENGKEMESIGDTEHSEDYRTRVHFLMSEGKTRKQAREAARYYLPAGMETKFVVTGNLRAWRDVLKKRDSEFADAEMQIFAKEVKRLLFGAFPAVFADIAGEPIG